jgi:hypothetical protein
MFDASTLLNTDINDAGSTDFVPIPTGEYIGIIKSIDAKEVVSQKSGTPMTYHFFEVGYTIDDANVRDITGMIEPRARQSMILDFTEAGALDMGKGKNVQLNRLRDACAQNVPGKPWNFNMLVGQAVRVTIKHRFADDGQIFAEVKGVAKL